MGIRRVAATVVLGTAFAVGTFAVPAQAAPLQATGQVASIKAAPATAMARWVAVDAFFFRSDCELERSYYSSIGYTSRCVFGGIFADWELQVLV